jgi:hypothetical protein
MENEVAYKVEEKRVALSKFDTRIREVERMIETKQLLLEKLKAERELKATALAHMEKIEAENQQLVDRYDVLHERQKELHEYYAGFEFSPDMPEEHKRKNDPELNSITKEKLELLELGKANMVKTKQIFYGKVIPGA